ncbi:hypothetical protein PMAYCL1PPCAC_26386 [Pristionchus mayeri]|uniref:Uncharacterized protein n=1 Tax=Pristionchus mayeri TaxID=1317129 RepID=A0AAN5IAS8_9BILA|nr:hypothetical protein PMAYCL1PPCAC_26386 [Pristionchus mayeri]
MVKSLRRMNHYIDLDGFLLSLDDDFVDNRRFAEFLEAVRNESFEVILDIPMDSGRGIVNSTADLASIVQRETDWISTILQTRRTSNSLKKRPEHDLRGPEFPAIRTMELTRTCEKFPG